MSTIKTRPTNGVSYGFRHTVTSGDATDGEITFDFQVDYDLAVTLQVQDSSGVNVDLADAEVTFPALGQVKLANGSSTFSLAQDQVINIVAQRASDAE